MSLQQKPTERPASVETDCRAYRPNFGRCRSTFVPCVLGFSQQHQQDITWGWGNDIWAPGKTPPLIHRHTMPGPAAPYAPHILPPRIQPCGYGAFMMAGRQFILHDGLFILPCNTLSQHSPPHLTYLRSPTVPTHTCSSVPLQQSRWFSGLEGHNLLDTVSTAG